MRRSIWTTGSGTRHETHLRKDLLPARRLDKLNKIMRQGRFGALVSEKVQDTRERILAFVYRSSSRRHSANGDSLGAGIVGRLDARITDTVGVARDSLNDS